MAGVRPTFITGANAKVRVNDKTLAFCTDLSYSVQILTQTPKILGMYEGSSVEPLGYTVSGSFSVIRYAKDIKSNVGADHAARSLAGNDAGNGVGNWGGVWGGTLGDFLARNGVGNDGRANEALDPSKFQNGVTFDIQVYQKTPGGDIGVANIRNVRITQADFQLTKRGAAVQRFNFVALYVDEDSFVADFSGIGQQFNGG
jgi:hypothetical protein